MNEAQITAQQLLLELWFGNNIFFPPPPPLYSHRFLLLLWENSRFCAELHEVAHHSNDQTLASSETRRGEWKWRNGESDAHSVPCMTQLLLFSLISQSHPAEDISHALYCYSTFFKQCPLNISCKTSLLHIMSIVSQRGVCYSFPHLCHIDYETCILHVMNYKQWCLLLFSIRITEALPPCVQRLRAHISLMFPSLCLSITLQLVSNWHRWCSTYSVSASSTAHTVNSRQAPREGLLENMRQSSWKQCVDMSSHESHCVV